MPPAARVTDMHTCPMVTGVVPHVGGPVLPPGAPTVFVGMMPVARVGDMCTCVGPPDVIVKGSATVLIGNMPAARMGDMTAHGGVIVLGCPTVMIGDSGSSGGGGGIGGLSVSVLGNGDVQVGENIVIAGTGEFKMKTLADLIAVGATKTGKQILNDLDDGTHKTTIQELDMATAKKNGALAGPDDPAASKDPKRGSNTTISYNPDVNLQMTDQSGKQLEYPPKSILAHEMIHAVHNDKGANLRDSPDPKDATGNQEESQTIGINDHENDALTENNFLKDSGAGWQRTDHDLSATTN